ncbi:MAG TPA: ATP-binding protein [Solirubrobacteraceae bacterium]|nr:ATP-binding protein [Solirubrobacteraceae bacterium]
MQPRQSAEERHARELDRVERAFAELGMLPGPALSERARDAATEAGDRAGVELARGLFALAAPAIAGDAGLIARLIDRLAVELAVTRAELAEALLAATELEGGPADVRAETLLALVEGGDRRLTRLGFDLHDGPLQELLLLGEDLRMFRGQLVSVLGEHERAALLGGRLDDLDARLAALERGLRRISTAVHGSFLAEGPFAQAVQELTDAFAQRTGIVPALRVEGDPARMSPSQRIALLSVVREALNNVREHADGVRGVGLAIAIGEEGVTARVSDDGCGFDVEAALLEAAHRGRIGLAGIHERVRLLGGECVVESRPGGPTAVSLTLPRWEPSAGLLVSAGS